MGTETKIIEIKCHSCGGQIQTTGHHKGTVICPWCDTECVIDGLVKNTEILNKENINSGVSINLNKPTLNARIVASMTASLGTFPLDILEKCTIVSEKHFCIPAYLFYCNAMASYNYEAGIDRQRSVPKEVDGKIQYNTETYTEWFPMSGAESVSGNIIVSGNRQFSNVLNELYKNFNPNKLIDVESLEFPKGFETLDFDYPQPAAFSECVTPRMEEKLKASAIKSLSSKKYRNFNLGSCNIQKNEVLRLWLGIYQIAIQYNDQVYTLFISGDGSSYCWSKQPVDEARAQAYQTKKDLEKKQSKSTYLVLAIICGICALITFGISLIPAGIFGYLYYKQQNELKATKAELDTLLAEGRLVRDRFLESGKFVAGL